MSVGHRKVHRCTTVVSCFSCYTEAYVLIGQRTKSKYPREGIFHKKTMMKANNGHSVIYNENETLHVLRSMNREL